MEQTDRRMHKYFAIDRSAKTPGSNHSRNSSAVQSSCAIELVVGMKL